MLIAVTFSFASSISGHVELLNVPSEQAQISGKFGIFVFKHRLPSLPQSNEHSKDFINLHPTRVDILHTSMNICINNECYQDEEYFR